MTRQEVFTALTPIFRDVFDDDGLELSESLAADQVEDWDSLSHIRLVVAVEKTLEIRFTSGEITELENVGEFVDLVLGKLG